METAIIQEQQLAALVNILAMLRVLALEVGLLLAVEARRIVWSMAKSVEYTLD